MRRSGIALFVVTGIAGCVGPRETQYLSWMPRRPDVEARSYDWHDPFPDERVGPDTASRPRAFIDPRTDTRKNFDQRFLQAVHPSAGTQLAAPQWPGYPPRGMVTGNALVPAYAVPPTTAGPIAVRPSSQYPWVVPVQ
jgi:hypothetical protein